MSETFADPAPTLMLEEQQVLAFACSYHRDNDCLPTTRELALACGFGSPNTAAHILDRLEAQGAISRDRRYRRVGTINTPAPEIPNHEQLWWCERDLIEYRATLIAIRAGIDLAPDLDATAFLHTEGLRRISVLRALEDTRGKLRDNGVQLTPEGERALATQRDVLNASNRLLTSWDAYCAVRLIWNLSAHEGLGRVRPLKLGYLGASLVASRRTTEALLPTYWALAGPALISGRPNPQLQVSLNELLRAVRQGLARHCPSECESSSVDVGALLATRAAS